MATTLERKRLDNGVHFIEHDDVLLSFNGMGSKGMSQAVGCHLFNAEGSGPGYKFFHVILGSTYRKPVTFLGDEQGFKPVRIA